MTDPTLTPDQDVVVVEMDMAAPPQRIFDALTIRELALQWSSKERYETILWEFDARLGGKWRSVARERFGDPGSRKVYDHTGEVLEFDPPRLLVYSWYTNWHEPPGHRTVVRWDFTPIPGGTRVKVTHSGLAALPQPREGYRQGWPGLLESVRKFVEK